MEKLDSKLGIDLGGTKIEGLLTDKSGAHLKRIRVKTPYGSYKGILNAIANLVTELATTSDLPVGIGIPGSISPASGRVRNSNILALNRKLFSKDLERTLGRLVRVANDANCFTISESVDGAGKEANSVFGVILGTGVGGGISINSQILEGRNAIAGEWGHNPLPRITTDSSGRRCYCGRTDCIESWLSGTGLSKTYRGFSNKNLTAEQIVKLYEDGEEAAIKTFSAFFDQLALALSVVTNILDPDIIVLGGGLSNIKSLYTEIPHRLEKLVFSDHFRTKIVKAKYGDSSGVRGAAWLW